MISSLRKEYKFFFFKSRYRFNLLLILKEEIKMYQELAHFECAMCFKKKAYYAQKYQVLNQIKQYLEIDFFQIRKTLSFARLTTQLAVAPKTGMFTIHLSINLLKSVALESRFVSVTKPKLKGKCAPYT